MRNAHPATLRRAARGLLAAMLACVCTLPLLASQRNIRFSQITLEHGLTQGTVTAALQDRHGFLWFGTQEGVNKYDGYQFKVYRHDPEDPSSLSHSFVWTMLEDRDGVIWVGTEGGLNRLNEMGRSFTRFNNDPSDPNSLSNDHVRVLHQDTSGRLWIGTDGGLNRYDAVTGAFVRYKLDPGNANPDRIRAIQEDREGRLLIGTYGEGLKVLDPASGEVSTLTHDPEDPHSLSDQRVRSIFEDSQGRLWVGTYQGGVNRFDSDSGRFRRYMNDPEDPHSLSHNLVRVIFEDSTRTLWFGSDSGLNEYRPETDDFVRYVADPVDRGSLGGGESDRVMSILEDSGGVMWVGTHTGLSKWNIGRGLFEHYFQDSSAPTSLSSNSVKTIYEDPDGSLWIGTYGGGLNHLDRDTGKYKHFVHDPDDDTSISDDRVMSLLVDRRGALWAGTLRGGLNRLDPVTGRFTRFLHDAEDPRSLGSNGVTSIMEDRDGVIWVGCYRGGLNRYDRATGGFTRFEPDPSDPTSLSNDRVTAAYQDSSGIIWIGTDGGGLSRFDPATGSFNRYENDPEDPNSLSSNVVWALYEDGRGTLWIGTQGAGLNAWHSEDRRVFRPMFHRFTHRDGLANDVIYGILGDDSGNLWISTNAGLTKFNPQQFTFRNYDVSDGLQSNEFNFGAYHRGASGLMYFGGIRGFNVFAPESIRDNPHVPPVRLTAFLKFNKEAETDQPIADVREIVLTHKDYVVAFEFTALDFTVPEKNRYAYMLEGFDPDWVDAGRVRRAVYTNLPPATYTLRVKASNNDGVWNEEGVSLEVKVLPPPWKTWWAYTGYGILVLCLALLGYRAFRNKLRREAEYSRKLEQEVASRTQELAQRNQELAETNHKLKEASLTDSLTGLRNRRFLLTYLQQDIARVLREHRIAQQGGVMEYAKMQNIAFVMVDLDGFKEINDTLGHAAGDEVLLQVRDLLKGACRESDTLIRWGGDEFLVVGNNHDGDSVEILAERIRAAIDQHSFRVKDSSDVYLSCSIGFACFPFVPDKPSLLTWEQVLAVADRGLYAAKNSSRNAWVGIFSTPSTPASGLTRRLLDHPDQLHGENLIEVRTSEQKPGDLVWDASRPPRRREAS